jgi:hypothetical protein
MLRFLWNCVCFEALEKQNQKTRLAAVSSQAISSVG